MTRAQRVALGTLLAIAACRQSPERAEAQAFPPARRPVARIVSPRWSDETSRDRAHEAADVMTRAGVAPGMTVADIGAGEGYYTIRLAEHVGAKGRVLAEEIIPDVRDALAERVARDRLDTVSVRLGTPDDPKLPDASFDRVFLVHMYHEIASPYAFLWHVRSALKPSGRLIVVDADRQPNEHGTPPALLKCEMAAVGLVQVDFQQMPSAGGYLAAFEARGERPQPAAIVPCGAPATSSLAIIPAAAAATFAPLPRPAGATASPRLRRVVSGAAQRRNAPLVAALADALRRHLVPGFSQLWVRDDGSAAVVVDLTDVRANWRDIVLAQADPALRPFVEFREVRFDEGQIDRIGTDLANRFRARFSERSWQGGYEVASERFVYRFARPEDAQAARDLVPADVAGFVNTIVDPSSVG